MSDLNPWRYMLTLSFCQTPDNPPDETLKLLSYRPDRLGHATFLNEDAIRIVMRENTPIEICLTSNLLYVYTRLSILFLSHKRSFEQV